MHPTLSQVSSLNASFEQTIKDYAAGKCDSIEFWMTKVEQYLNDHTVEDVRRLLDEQQMSAPVASYQGGLLTSQGPARQEAWAQFDRRLDLCRQLGVGMLVIACDIPRPLDQQAIERAQVSLQQAAQHAGQRQMRVALEFQAGSALGNNLQTAAALVDEVGSPHLGICFDVFHFYLGPSMLEDLHYLTARNLFHVQLSDLADVPRELAVDANRILPGDGDFQLAPILEHLAQIGYGGPVAIELLNPQIWQIPPLQFGEIAITALRKLLGQSERG